MQIKKKAIRKKQCGPKKGNYSDKRKSTLTG